MGCLTAAFAVEEACEENDVDANLFLPKIQEAAKAAA
jgi:hypothetical protein